MPRRKLVKENGFNIDDFVARDDDFVESDQEDLAESSDSDSSFALRDDNIDDDDEHCVTKSGHSKVTKQKNKHSTTSKPSAKVKAKTTPPPSAAEAAYPTPSKSPAAGRNAAFLKRKASQSTLSGLQRPRRARKVADITSATSQELDELIGKDSSTDSDEVASDFETTQSPDYATDESESDAEHEGIRTKGGIGNDLDKGQTNVNKNADLGIKETAQNSDEISVSSNFCTDSKGKSGTAALLDDAKKSEKPACETPLSGTGKKMSSSGGAQSPVMHANKTGGH